MRGECRPHPHHLVIILFTVLLVHLILRISPHHSHHLRSHHLSLPLHFTPDLKLISFTNPFLHSHSYSLRTASTDLNLYWIKGALFVCFSFWLRVLDKAVYSAFDSTLNISIVSYRITRSLPESHLPTQPSSTQTMDRPNLVHVWSALYLCSVCSRAHCKSVKIVTLYLQRLL